MTEYFVHESARVDDRVRIGNGTKIWHFSHILSDTIIGERCVLGQNVMVGPKVKIGNRCKIQNNVSVYTGVELEDGVFCGPSMVFTNVINPRSFIERKDEFRTTLVKRGASLGANCTILCGNTIGQYAMVAAGAVVTEDVPAYAVIAGVPASRIGWVCQCGNTLRDFDPGGNTTCEHCRNEYKLEELGLIPITEEELIDD